MGRIRQGLQIRSISSKRRNCLCSSHETLRCRMQMHSSLARRSATSNTWRTSSTRMTIRFPAVLAKATRVLCKLWGEDRSCLNSSCGPSAYLNQVWDESVIHLPGSPALGTPRCRPRPSASAAATAPAAGHCQGGRAFENDAGNCKGAWWCSDRLYEPQAPP